MIRQSRRELLKSLSIAIFGCSCTGRALAQGSPWPQGATPNHEKPNEVRVLAASPNPDDHNWGRFRRAGCTFNRSNANSGAGGIPQIVPYSGNPEVDAAYQREGLALVEIFEVKPAGGYFNDSSGPNAFATPIKYFQNSYDGTIAFGIRLLDMELRRDYGRGLSVPAIMAHEFAHIYQFMDGSLADVATPVRELHADFLAGWYMARRNISESLMKPALDAFFGMGDYHFNSPNHHGTPMQRLRSLLAGYADSATSIEEAFQSGLEHVASIL